MVPRMKIGGEVAPHGDVAEKLLWLRERVDMSQTAFAKTIGANQTQYSNWETGRQRLPLSGALRLVAIYGVTLDFLYLNRTDTLPASLLKEWMSR